MMYKLNNEFVIREDDLAIFSLKDLEIYKFTEEGYSLIKFIRDSNSVSLESLNDYCVNKFNIDNSDFKFFIDKLIDKNIIVECL